LSLSSSPFYSSYFGDRVLPFAQAVLEHDSPILCLPPSLYDRCMPPCSAFLGRDGVLWAFFPQDGLVPESFRFQLLKLPGLKAWATITWLVFIYFFEGRAIVNATIFLILVSLCSLPVNRNYIIYVFIYIIHNYYIYFIYSPGWVWSHAPPASASWVLDYRDFCIFILYSANVLNFLCGASQAWTETTS
jgi:hypothetical protein